MKDKSRRHTKGFTLIEIMIVVAIIAIITVIAVPSYQNYILRGHRVDARNTLQAAAQRMEQNFSASRTYAENRSTNPATPINQATLESWALSQSPAGGQARYNISFVAGPTDTEYTLQAVPINGQTGDECGILTINQSNVRIARGRPTTSTVPPSPRTDISRRCWSR